MAYYRRLRDMREDHDMSQRQVADYLIMKQQQYQRYESGVTEISVSDLVRLADLYNTSTDYLLGRTDDPTPPKDLIK